MLPGKKISLYLMIVLYMAAGINHFVHPEPYLEIMPPWLPWHLELVWISGIAEIVCALLLLFPSTRRLGAWCLIVLLVAVFPANVQMAINYYKEDHPRFWLTLLRLPLQIVLILWAYRFTKPPAA